MLNKSHIALFFGSAQAMRLTREPLLTWAPTPPKSHPINYFVPNFGTDHDISASLSNVGSAESTIAPWDYGSDK